MQDEEELAARDGDVEIVPERSVRADDAEEIPHAWAKSAPSRDAAFATQRNGR